MNSVKRQERHDTERWAPQVSRCPICYQRRVEKKFQKNWRDGAKAKTAPQLWVWLVMEVKSWCWKEQYCIGSWNVRSMNQGKLQVVKQEMATVNTNILGISGLKWAGIGELNSDDHYICYCGQESLRRNGVAITVNKRVWNVVLGCNLKNKRMISVCFQGKPFNITVI